VAFVAAGVPLLAVLFLQIGARRASSASESEGGILGSGFRGVWDPTFSGDLVIWGVLCFIAGLAWSCDHEGALVSLTVLCLG
jgi:hypothetical protein